MGAFQDYSLIHWLFIFSQFLLITYHVFRFRTRDERKNWLALIFLIALIAYNFTLGWRDSLLFNVALNMSGIMTVVFTMLINFFRPKRKAATVVDLYERSPDELFITNCRHFGLSAREIEVVLLVRKGCRNKEIADELFISEKTVESHLQHIFDKVGERSRLTLITRLNS